MKKGQCKLCLQTKELCRESHILSNFLYGFLMAENNEVIFVDSKKVQKRFNGEYEANILCENCDSKIIGKLEDYAAKFMHGKFSKRSSLKNIGGNEYLIVEGHESYDYKKYKLFLLSLLWRSSISSRPFFKQVKLANEDEENLRKRILESDPGDPDIYPCLLKLPPLTQTPEGGRGFNTLHMPTMSPMMTQGSGWKICKFIIQGMSLYFIISKPIKVTVEPSVESNRLSFGFSTIKEQNDLINMSIEMIKNHTK